MRLAAGLHGGVRAIGMRQAHISLSICAVQYYDAVHYLSLNNTDYTTEMIGKTTMSATLSHEPIHRETGKGGLFGIGRAIAGFFDGLSRGIAASHDAKRLLAMSDHELERLGMVREDVVRAVMTRHFDV